MGANNDLFFEKFAALPASEQKRMLGSYSPDEQIAMERSFNKWKVKNTSGATSAWRGIRQGTAFGFADELGGMAAAAGIASAGKQGGFTIKGKHYSPEEADALFASQGYESTQPDKVQAYSQAKEAEVAEDAVAQRANPKMFLAGEVGGGILSSAVLPTGAMTGAAGKAATIGTRLKSTLPYAVGYGAAAGLGNSDADLIQGGAEHYGQAAKDMAIGGAFSGGLSALGTAGGRLLDKRAAKLAEGAKVGDKAALQAFKAQHPNLRDYRGIPESEQIEIGQKLLDEGVLKSDASWWNPVKLPANAKTMNERVAKLDTAAQDEVGNVYRKLGQVQEDRLIPTEPIAQNWADDVAKEFPGSAPHIENTREQLLKEGRNLKKYWPTRKEKTLRQAELPNEPMSLELLKAEAARTTEQAKAKFDLDMSGPNPKYFLDPETMEIPKSQFDGQPSSIVSGSGDFGGALEVSPSAKRFTPEVRTASPKELDAYYSRVRANNRQFEAIEALPEGMTIDELWTAKKNAGAASKFDANPTYEQALNTLGQRKLYARYGQEIEKNASAWAPELANDLRKANKNASLLRSSEDILKDAVVKDSSRAVISSGDSAATVLGLLAGGPAVATAAGLSKHMLRTRGNSMAAVVLDKIAKDPQLAEKYIPQLLQAYARSPEALEDAVKALNFSKDRKRAKGVKKSQNPMAGPAGEFVVDPTNLQGAKFR